MQDKRMFQVDLLNGHGIPAKCTTRGIAITIIAVATPLIIAIAMLGIYLNDKITVSVQRQEIASYQDKIDGLAGAVKVKTSFEKKKANINACLSEISGAMSRHFQWSPVLVELVKNMPDSMVLTNLEARQRYVKQRVPKKGEPGKFVAISVPARTLTINVSGSTEQNYEKDVRDFRDRLQSSPVLASKLKNIIVSQKADVLDGKDVIAYEIDCVFTPQL